ncbi:MFS general substrate transporter [Roridomyces roridus]|uniref:MFS general substrate transporter n=1 Tax=Roridomyces roridus TaxID=1738132 RepID=A0AAD7C8V1_9AGAR|nr:MFS general substrate transporter [Roridomyces roridus]
MLTISARQVISRHLSPSLPSPMDAVDTVPSQFSTDDKESRSNVENDEVFPDGGLKAWVVLVGTITGFFATFGYVNSWGVFQAYYQQTLLRHSTPSQIAWIGSIQHCMVFLPSALVGRLFDLGYFRVPFASGTLLIVIATFLVPQCKVYWHYLICQGLVVGIGCGLMFCSMFTAVTHWWNKRRGFALGLMAGGGALGGTVLPIVIRQLITHIGFPWAMRTMGFILMLLLVITNLCVRPRLPPAKSSNGFLGIRVIHAHAFSVFCFGAFVQYLGLFTSEHCLLTYVSSSAITFGLSSEFAFYLPAIVNFTAGFGRIASGTLADRMGPMNITIITSVLTGVTTLMITAISILYGFFSGAWIALIGSIVGQMGHIEAIGRRLGVVNSLSSIATVCGPPISGLLTSSALGYKGVGFFAGSALFVSAIATAVSRWLAAPGVRRKY